MITITDIYHKIDEMTADELNQLMDYIQNKKNIVDNSPQLPTRIFDMHPGAMIMSDDFDAELPDSFWFGEGNE